MKSRARAAKIDDHSEQEFTVVEGMGDEDFEESSEPEEKSPSFELLQSEDVLDNERPF